MSNQQRSKLRGRRLNREFPRSPVLSFADLRAEGSPHRSSRGEHRTRRNDLKRYEGALRFGGIEFVARSSRLQLSSSLGFAEEYGGHGRTARSSGTGSLETRSGYDLDQLGLHGFALSAWACLYGCARQVAMSRTATALASKRSSTKCAAHFELSTATYRCARGESAVSALRWPNPDAGRHLVGLHHPRVGASCRRARRL